MEMAMRRVLCHCRTSYTRRTGAKGRLIAADGELYSTCNNQCMMTSIVSRLCWQIVTAKATLFIVDADEELYGPVFVIIKA